MAGGLRMRVNFYWIKVTHLDFSEAHHPNFEQLILYCLSSVTQAAPQRGLHTFARDKLVKKVGLNDVGVTIAMKR